MNTIEEVQRRVHDIRHMIKQWQNVRQQRRDELKSVKRSKERDDHYRSYLVYLQQKTKHQDEEIGSLYEILCATLELQNDEMRILMQTVEDITKTLSEAPRSHSTNDPKDMLRTEGVETRNGENKSYKYQQQERRSTNTYSMAEKYMVGFKRKRTKQKEDNRLQGFEEQNTGRKTFTNGLQETTEVAHQDGLRQHGEAAMECRCVDSNAEMPKEPITETNTEGPVQPIPETIHVSLDMWLSCARDEVDKVKALRSKSPITGQCTVLCLDISESMEGEAWTQMKTFVTNYLQCIEKVSSTEGIHENVSMVTFGHETCVVHHASTDYRKLQMSFDKLTPDGPSPMFAGLLFAEAAATEANFEEDGYTIFPRIVLVTDGKVTPGDIIAGPDQYLGIFDFVSPLQVEQRAKILGKKSCELHIVPAGQDTEMGILKRLAEVTYGRVIDTKETQERFCRSFRNNMVAVKILTKHGALLNNLADLQLAAKLEEPELTQEDLDDIRWHVVNFIHREREEDDAKYLDLEGSGLPPVGTRVRRGPEWDGLDDADENGPGTIVGVRPDSQVHVNWDCGGSGVYSYGGQDGAFQVVIVDDIRDNSDGDGVGHGTLVKRGPDWNGGDEDGGPGSIGVVFRAKLYEIVDVRWRNGLKKSYNFGFGGQREVEPCNVEDIIRFKSMSKEVKRTDVQSPYSLSYPSMEMREHPDTVTMDDLLGASCGDEEVNTEETDFERKLHSLVNQEESGNDSEELHEQLKQKEQRKRRNKNAPVEDTRLELVQDSFSDRMADHIIPGNEENRETSRKNDRRDLLQIIPLGHFQEHSSREVAGLDILSINERNKRNSHVYGLHLDEMDAQNKADKTDNTSSYVWQYRKHDSWKNYPVEVNLRIERSFKSNPKSTMLVTIEGEKYRILLSKLQQVNVQTKQITEVQRIGSGE